MTRARIQPGKQYPRWPAIPDDRASRLMSLLFQLEQSQWWSAERLWENQSWQLGELLSHAYRTVPFYRKRLKAAGFNPGKKVTDDIWCSLPILTREEVQEAGELLESNAIPSRHGDTFMAKTSGSTARPVSVKKTWVSTVFMYATDLRYHIWARRDMSGMFCAIKPGYDLEKAAYPKGQRADDWGYPTGLVFDTGPLARLHLHTSIEDQVKWLRRKKPSYLLTITSNLLGLASHCLEEGIELPGLKDISAMGEVVTEEVRGACRQAWGAEVFDSYSSIDVGPMAAQCPDNEHLHIQGETTMVEILDESGQPCAPGETGRVVATPLHNYAMPLIRYAVGDYAVAGALCSCGRGLPVIEKVLGRTRNMLHLPDGRRFFPSFLGHTFSELAPVKQYQILQKTVESLDVRFVVARPMTAEEETAVTRFLQERLGYPFKVNFTYVDAIERAKSGKFEEFKSEITPPSRSQRLETAAA